MATTTRGSIDPSRINFVNVSSRGDEPEFDDPPESKMGPSSI
jgi:hypothetical protein